MNVSDTPLCLCCDSLPHSAGRIWSAEAAPPLSNTRRGRGRIALACDWKAEALPPHSTRAAFVSDGPPPPVGPVVNPHTPRASVFPVPQPSPELTHGNQNDDQDERVIEVVLEHFEEDLRKRQMGVHHGVDGGEDAQQHQDAPQDAE